MFKQSTRNLRVKLACLPMQILAPKLYLDVQYMIGLDNDESVTDVPRPSIKWIKQKYNTADFVGVEVGVHMGLNAESIIQMLNPKMFCAVDIKVFDEARKRLPKTVKFIEKSSVETAKSFADKSLDFVYIDAAHDYLHVKEDLAAWYP